MDGSPQYHPSHIDPITRAHIIGMAAATCFRGIELTRTTMRATSVKGLYSRPAGRMARDYRKGGREARRRSLARLPKKTAESNNAKCDTTTAKEIAKGCF